MTEAESAYTAELRRIINTLILEFFSAGYLGSADKLEDALDKADALIGKGPYADSG